MALHSQLPIYRVSRDLFAMVVQLTRKFPRDLRATVGGRLQDDTFNLVMLVFRANVATNKVPFLDQMIEHTEATKLLLRLCMDLRAISQKEYAAAIDLTNNIGKQANGWRTQQRR